MNFLEATRAVRNFAGGPPLPFVLAMSGTAEPLLLYLRAVATEHGRLAEPHILLFNTLQQALYQAPANCGREVVLLMPWDIIPELDWRSGIPSTDPNEVELRARAGEFFSRLRKRESVLLYLDAPCPPLWLDHARNVGLRLWLKANMVSINTQVLAGELFSLSSYLGSGLPVNGKALGTVAGSVIEALLRTREASSKVLVTDLDQTLWSGIIGDDGLDGIAFRAEGQGFRHFVYQTMLRRLRDSGVLLAAVSKNDPEAALAPFRAGEMLLKESDFVTILASWNAKSSQLRALAEQLNLGLDSLVFIDDNPVEIAEVTAELPLVHVLQFPDSEAELPGLLDRLAQLFERKNLTEEDRERTAHYQRRLKSMVPSDVKGADLRGFLLELEMSLIVSDRTVGDHARAVQLLNKTNQFNANGERRSEAEIEAAIADGSRLYTATLSDRTGSHGEILVALVSRDGILTSIAMSCRVFQRRVEFAFLHWLSDEPSSLSGLRYAETERNGPFKTFLLECVGDHFGPGELALDPTSIRRRFVADRELFRMVIERATT